MGEKSSFNRIIKSIDSQVEKNRIGEGDLRMADISEIILRMDSYDDIYSDFDPRAYSKRSLSDDFLLELRKASLDKLERVELRIIVPKEKKDKGTESLLKKRLKDHFSRHLSISRRDMKSLKTLGISLTLLGAFLLTIASYFYYRSESYGFFHQFLLTLLEPAGWFTAWEGMYLIIFGSSEKKTELNFYKKMDGSNIVFDYY